MFISTIAAGFVISGSAIVLTRLTECKLDVQKFFEDLPAHLSSTAATEVHAEVDEMRFTQSLLALGKADSRARGGFRAPVSVESSLSESALPLR